MKDENGHSVCIELRQIANMIQREVCSCKGSPDSEQLSDMSGWVLGYIAAKQETDVFQRDIEEQLSVRRSTVSKMITLLEQKGLVRRISVPYDARLKRLEITEKARNLIEPLKENADAVEKKLTDGLSEDEIYTLCVLLHKLRSNLV